MVGPASQQRVGALVQEPLHDVEALRLAGSLRLGNHGCITVLLLAMKL
jgi:hypothetical protein